MEDVIILNDTTTIQGPDEIPACRLIYNIPEDYYFDKLKNQSYEDMFNEVMSIK